MPTTKPYGSWESPITIDMLTKDHVSLSSPLIDGTDLYWSEGRPSEGGRTAIVRRRADGTTSDVTPGGFDARSRIHEYGGTSYAVHDGVVLASRFEDQRVYRLDGNEPEAITPEPEVEAGDRYAGLVFHGDVVLAVRERHAEGSVEATNEIVAFPLDGSSAPVVVSSGHDFYSTLRRSADGTRLAFLTWDHPRMPWDGTELWVADLAADGSLGSPHLVAGGPQVSVFQPEWGPDGALFWVSDQSGWWNLFREGVALAPAEAEYGTPAWEFGYRCYGFLEDGSIVAVATERGKQALVRVAGEDVAHVPFPYDTITPYLAASGTVAWMVAGDAATPLAVVGVDVATGTVQQVRQSFTVEVDRGYFSHPETIEAPTTGGALTHAFYYPPANPGYVAPTGELPPLVVWTHGGPTGAVSSNLNLGVQFWTSRGIGVVDVNYRGSTGYGRAYRAALEGQWGIVDTDDCIAVAMHLAATGRADAARLAIRGGSAGGYTTLCALTFHDVFAAGTSYFGVADCRALAEDTHKFESRYLDSLMGPYPEAAAVYDARSPLHHAERITCPVLLLHGEEDKVVVPAQAEVMAAALERSEVPYAYILFPGEGHGFRKAENMAAALAAELAFYGQVFGFAPADDLPLLRLS